MNDRLIKVIFKYMDNHKWRGRIMNSSAIRYYSSIGDDINQPIFTNINDILYIDYSFNNKMKALFGIDSVDLKPIIKYWFQLHSCKIINDVIIW